MIFGWMIFAHVAKALRKPNVILILADDLGMGDISVSTVIELILI